MGDRVVMLQGVSMPMVLRRCRENGEAEELWRLVGPVVVRGIMGGEAKTLIKDGTIERKVFKIR